MGLARVGAIELLATLAPAHASAPPRHRIDAADVTEASLVARGGRDRLARMTKTHGSGSIHDLTNGGSANFEWTAARPGELDYRMEPAATRGFYELRVHGGAVTEHERHLPDLTRNERGQ